MRKTVMVFIPLLLVLASCFITGCSSLPFSGSPAPSETRGNVDVGFSEIENPVITQRYQFEEALTEINSPDSQAKWNDSEVSLPEENTSRDAVFPQKHIKHIRGSDLDQNGDASSWTFVVEHGDQFSIVTFNRQGVTVSNSPGTLRQTEIFTDHIISPRKLFEKNRDVIFNTTRTGTAVTRDLSLGGGNYTLFISDHGTPRALVFDATTGVLTSSND